MAISTKNPKVLEWLLEEDQPSVRYYALTDLLERDKKDTDVKKTAARIPHAGWARDILGLQKPKGYWEPFEPTSFRGWLRFLYFPVYRSTIWRGIVLSDLGLTSKDLRIKRMAEQIFEYKLRLGTMVNIFTEEVCNVGNTARMLTRFGYGDDYRVKKLYERLLEDQREDGGWNRRQNAPGTLDGWEALATFSTIPRQSWTRRIKHSIEVGVEFYLERKLFEEGERKYLPWFRFHYPNHYYYDILVGLDLITKLGYAGDRRLEPALEILRNKRQKDGTWLLDMVHPDIGAGANFSPFDSRDKVKPLALEKSGNPSKWITLTALRVLKRVEEAR